MPSRGDACSAAGTCATAFRPACAHAGCGEPTARARRLYWLLGRPSPAVLLALIRLDEADLPAQRAPAEAQARLPRADVDPRRPRDPQAPPREGPQAALGLTRRHSRVQRRHRLSRSRDFDAVYRQGRSVSTRFLVLYWFPREDERRAAARARRAEGRRHAVVRNRVKRQLREAWRARLERAAAGPATTCSSCGPGSPRRPRRAASTGSASGSTRCSAKAAA